EVDEHLFAHMGRFAESRIERREHAHGTVQRLPPDAFEQRPHFVGRMVARVEFSDEPPRVLDLLAQTGKVGIRFRNPLAAPHSFYYLVHRYVPLFYRTHVYYIAELHFSVGYIAPSLIYFGRIRFDDFHFGIDVVRYRIVEHLLRLLNAANK